jgi:7-cyano-7-deazaguanine synthase in queuosine biosynthesis
MFIDCYGLDYIITEDGPVLLEMNGHPGILIERRSFTNEEEYILQSKNRGYFQAISLINILKDNKDIKGITLLFKKGENDIQVNTIENILKDNDISVEINNDVESGKLKCKDGWVIFTRLGATPQFSHIYNDKLITKKIIEDSDLDLLTPSVKKFKYDKNSRFPNVVGKPIDGSLGSGVRFYKTDTIQGDYEKVEISGENFYESYIECIPLTEKITHIGEGKLEKIPLGDEYVYDIRVTVAYYNDKWYPFFELKRIAKDPLPKKMNDGAIITNHFSYLTNLTQGSTIGFLEKELKEELVEKTISVLSYVTNRINKGKVKNVFWSGGQSSTYRVIELLLSGYIVNPFYMAFPLDGEKGVAERIINIDKLHNLIQKKLSKYKDNLLPINYIYENDITMVMTKKYSEKMDFLPKKYFPLMNYAIQTNQTFEVCVALLGVSNDKLKSHLNNIGEHTTHTLELFKRITFPNVRIDKLNTYVLLYYKGYHTLIDETWDCDTPNNSKECKKCSKCLERKTKLIYSGIKLGVIKDDKDKK